MRIILQPSMILHSRPYRETSLLLDILTLDHGRISAIAKGVRRPRASTQALLQVFTPLLLSWYGRGELVTLSQIELNGAAIQLQGHCLFAGLYLNELLTRLLQKDDPHPEIFTLYRDTLHVLQSTSLDEKILRLFEKRLLEELGYGFLLDAIKQKILLPEKYYEFHPEQGFILSTLQITADNIFSGNSLLAFAAESLTDDTILRDAKRLVRLMLAHLLGDRPLNSRQLFVK